MGVFFPAAVGHIQRIGKVQKRLHLGGVELMGSFQITVNLRQPLQAVNIHDPGAIPGKQLLRMMQKVFIQPLHQ